MRWRDNFRSAYPVIVLSLSIAVAAFFVMRWAPPEPGLRLARSSSDDGNPLVRTGSKTYPRRAIDSDDAEVRMVRPAQRIVSQYWSIDEFVYAVVPPERVVAVSESAYNPQISNVLDSVNRFHPVIATDPERVLRLNSDLILVASTARADFTNLLRGAGYPIYRIYTMFTNLKQIQDHIQLVGYLTGEDERAAEELQQFQREIGQARARKPVEAASPRILGLGGRYSYGSQTLFHDIVRAVGGINVGAENGLSGYEQVSSEQILRWNPDWIVASADKDQTKQVLERLLADPSIALTSAAQKKQILVFEHRAFLPMSPYSRIFVTALSKALYEGNTQ
ncbi:MAG: ABC transporter substrate-binding protein [Candidatus Korobacteraceae bacterium]